MVYAPFIERFKDFFAAVKLYDMTQERPKIKAWIEVYHHEIILCLVHLHTPSNNLFATQLQELNKIDAYAATWGDRRVQLAAMMKKFGVKSHILIQSTSIQQALLFYIQF